MAQRVLGENHEETLKLRWDYARSLCMDDGATLDDLREAVTTFEDATRIGRRVLCAAHPTALGLGSCLEKSRAMLRACETPGSS